MRFRTKLAMASAAAALMAGTAYADTTLIIAPSGQGINGVAVADTDAVAEGGTTVNLAAGSNFLNQNGTLVLQATSDAAFGLSGNPGNVVINLDGTGFVLNGTPTIGSSVAATMTTNECADVTFPAISSGGATGDASVAWDNISDLAQCDGTGPSGGVLTVELPVIMTDTSLGISASANIDVQVTATGGTAEADALDDPAVTTVEPFAAAILADTSPPELSLASDPSFTAFNNDGDVGVVSVDQFGGGSVTEIADAANNPVANPAEIDVDVTVADATGIDKFTLMTPNGTVDLVANGNLFSVTLDGTTDLTAAELITDSVSTLDPVTGATLTAVLTGTEMVQAQSLSAVVDSKDGSDAIITSASTSGSLADLTREGTTAVFDWVGLGESTARTIWRIIGVPADTAMFATVLNPNNGSNINDADVTTFLDGKRGANGEITFTSQELGDYLRANAGLAMNATRADISVTIEAPAGDVDIDRILLAAGGVTTTGDLDN